MEKQQFCYNKASNIYDYYYNLAIKEFNHSTADTLAKIPADYIYNTLMENYPNCYINDRCCMKYCNEMLDTEFEKLDPTYKREIYNKVFGVSTNAPIGEINIQLKAKRRKFKKIFNDAVRRVKAQQENDISVLLEGITLSKRKKTDNLEQALKNIKLN